MIKLDKRDYSRALLTDTSPSDVPIIFSNDGLYINIRSVPQEAPDSFDVIYSIVKNLINLSSTTEPFEYKIYKNEIKFRSLSLIHPASQLGYAKFYRDYSSAIIYLCSKSSFSIRAPKRVSNSLYLNDGEGKNNYKEFNIDTIDSDIHKKHANSYFSYAGFDRAYKIYTSPLFFRMEKLYPILWTLDISNCFDSIYTHSIGWAIKNRNYIKASIKGDRRHQFCDELDSIMKASNHAETNGIPIGSEFSRVFSEILLQSIDFDVVEEVSKRHGYKCRRDYSVMRYVDDYFLFAKDSEVANNVALIIADKLYKYNLYFNESKLAKFDRPFITNKTSILSSVESLLNNLMDKLYVSIGAKNENTIQVNRIINRSKFTNGFIREVKCSISIWKGKYSDVSSFLISSITRRIERVIRSKIISFEDQDIVVYVRDCICILIEIIFFFYTIAPSVSASNRVSRIIILADSFISKNMPNQCSYFRAEIMRHIQDVILKFDKDKPDNYIFLERLNIFLATAYFGNENSIPPSYFDYIKAKDINYFEIVSVLYYFRGREKYANFTTFIEDLIILKCSNIKRLKFSSEMLHIFLDSLTCPYLSSGTRMILLDKYLSEYEPGVTFSDQDKNNILSLMTDKFWFVKWKDLNLVHLLERKELRASY